MDAQLKRVRFPRDEGEAANLEKQGYEWNGHLTSNGRKVFVLRGGGLGGVDEESADAIETTFGLERDLQAALRKNIEQLEQGLRIVDGDKEQSVQSGRIDITAEDQSGTTVIIELKAGTADREAVAQILTYMGDLIREGKSVRGILVAGDFMPRTIAAALAVPNLQLRKYGFQFSFEAIGLQLADTAEAKPALLDEKG